MSLRTRFTWVSLLTILAICAILPNRALAILFSQPGTLSLSFTALANGSVSSTVTGSGNYVVAAPSGLTSATWGGGCSGASTVSGFSASGGTWSATFTTPASAGTGCTLTVTGTGSNTLSATSPGVTISSSSGASVIACAAGTIASPTTGLLVTASVINIECQYSAAITISGTPTITLDTSPAAVVNCTSVTGGNTLVCPYTVASGQNTPNTTNQPYLTTASSAAIGLPGGATITAGGVAATNAGANGQVFTSLEVNTGASYFVATTGNDSNAGTFASPFLTMQKCQTAMRGGATKQCYVLAGTYGGTTCNVSVIGFTDTAYICPTGSDNGEFWSGYPGQVAIMDGGSTSSTTGVALAWGLNGVTGFNINGFTMQNLRHGGLDGAGVSGLTFSNNHCHNLYSMQTSQGCAFLHYQMANIVLSNNLGDGYLGSFFLGMGTGDGDPGMSGYFAITYNSAVNTNQITSDSGCYYVDDASHTNRNGTISYNTCNNAGISSSQSICLYLDDDSSYWNLTSNRCSGTYQYAMLIHGGDHNVAQYNVFDVSNAYKVGLYQDDPAHDVGGGGMAGNVFENNIVYSSASLPGTLWDYIDTSLTIANPSIADGLYSNATAYGDGSHFTDSTPTVGNPLFINVGALNYQVQTTSPALAAPVNFIQLPSWNPGLVGPHAANDNLHLDELRFVSITRTT